MIGYERPNILELAETQNPTSCLGCGCNKLYAADHELVCTGCGIVLGTQCQLQETVSSSKLNLYQVTEIGTKRVNLECARHIHENKSDVSQISNVCVKLDLPIYAAQEINIIYQKLSRQKQLERNAYAEKLEKVSDLVQKGLEGEESIGILKRNRPKGCTKAHIAAFAVHLACRKYGLPKSDEQILEAIRMNFGIKRNFTILKAYSLNEIAAQELGIECRYHKASYYMRLLLSRLQGTIGSGHLYDTIERQAVANLQNIDDKREDVRAKRALDLAIRGAKLHVRV
ncbi:MAG: hypothetical protein KGI27_12730 [Thaumarchaeota archaeon]|nr:hypothetical protein [Nitrososphaerota archaeon]